MYFLDGPKQSQLFPMPDVCSRPSTSHRQPPANLKCVGVRTIGFAKCILPTFRYGWDAPRGWHEIESKKVNNYSCILVEVIFEVLPKRNKKRRQQHHCSWVNKGQVVWYFYACLFIKWNVIITEMELWKRWTTLSHVHRWMMLWITESFVDCRADELQASTPYRSV